MIGRTSFVVASIVALLTLIFGHAASAQDGFKMLGEKEIRARLIGRDMTDNSHWVTWLRRDGVFLTNEMGRKWTGIWKIQNNKLCMSNPGARALDCNEVWMFGKNARLRARKNEETFDVVVEKHKAH